MIECSCGGSKPVIFYACSGAADVGLLSDLTARKLSDDKMGVMSCLAAVGAGLSGFVESAKAADRCVAIDGCMTACAKKNLEKAGIAPVSFVLTEMGYSKGSTDVNENAVNEAVLNIKNNLCG